MKQSIDHSLGVGRATNSGNTRTAGKEQYYTPESTSKRLVEIAQRLIPDLKERTLIEPAAGTGSFLKAFDSNGCKNIIALDIDPKAVGIMQVDFLKDYLLPELVGAVSITNPPFGRNSSLSVPFFNKLASHCDYICFVVPKSWRKWSVQNRLDSSFHLIYDEDLSIDYVDEHGENLVTSKGSLATIFQVWEKCPESRKKKKVMDHEIVKRTTPEKANVSLTIFGRGCGKVKTDFPRKPNTTQMFLELCHPRALEALRSADLSQFYNNVAFVEALSWDELNYAINEYLDLPLTSVDD